MPISIVLSTNLFHAVAKSCLYLDDFATSVQERLRRLDEFCFVVWNIFCVIGESFVLY